MPDPLSPFISRRVAKTIRDQVVQGIQDARDIGLECKYPEYVAVILYEDGNAIEQVQVETWPDPVRVINGDTPSGT